jgi:hypothetical protein
MGFIVKNPPKRSVSLKNRLGGKKCDTRCTSQRPLDNENSTPGSLHKLVVMWYYCAVTGESKKIVFTSGATEKITSGVATSDFWSPHK